jgi:hypothetical protein
MKGLKALAVVMVVTGLLVSAGSATAAGPAYKHYVGCGLSRKAAPSHACPKGSKKGAFFEPLNADVFYTVCVSFPNGRNLCARHQPPNKKAATAGHLYVNKISSTVIGRHVVSWFVKGKKVGSFAFRVTG